MTTTTIGYFGNLVEPSNISQEAAVTYVYDDMMMEDDDDSANGPAFGEDLNYSSMFEQCQPKDDQLSDSGSGFFSFARMSGKSDMSSMDESMAFNDLMPSDQDMGSIPLPPPRPQREVKVETTYKAIEVKPNTNNNNGTSRKRAANCDERVVVFSEEDRKMQQQLVSRDKRRERNKLLARKTRIKKKAEVEDLQEKLAILKNENDRLRNELNNYAPSPIDADFLIGENFAIPDNIARIVSSCLKSKHGLGHDLPSYCITSALAKGNPIVYASPEFLRLTGYSLKEVIGRNCRFLQGTQTEKKEVKKLSRAIADGREETVLLKNYRKDGSVFINRIRISPLADGSGRVMFYLGEQCEVNIGPSASTCGKFNSSRITDRVVSSV